MLFDIQEQRVYAYPYEGFKADLSKESQIQLEGIVMKKYVQWMNEKGYMNEEEYEESTETVAELKDDLPKVEELATLIFDYIQDNPTEDWTETIEGYFQVTKTEPGKLWLEDYIESGENIGPVFVSNEILRRTSKNGINH